VHYEAESPERSFVGTIKPRIETDMGFRVPGKVAKRLVEVGQTVDVGQPLATLDEVDLKTAGRAGRCGVACRHTRAAQAAAAEQRAKDLRAKGWTTDAQMDQAKAAARRGAGAASIARNARVELTNNSLSYATLVPTPAASSTATLIDAGQVVASGQTAIRVCALCGKEAVVRDPGDALGPRQGWRGNRDPVVGAEQRSTPQTLREIAPAADPATRTYLAKFSFARCGGNVSLGMTATLTLADPATERVARLPLSAAVQPGRRSLALYRRASGDVTLKTGRGQILREQ